MNPTTILVMPFTTKGGGFWVKITFDGPSPRDPEQHVMEISKWATNQQVADRMSYDMWKCHSKEDQLNFVLRWNGARI
jgi:hypothetical protein